MYMYIPCVNLMRSDFTKKRYSDVLTSNIQSESHMVQPPYVISYYLILGFRGGHSENGMGYTGLLLLCLTGELMIQPCNSSEKSNFYLGSLSLLETHLSRNELFS